MKTSQIGVDLIKHFEGFESKPYLCPAGIPTIGYGSTFYENKTKVTLLDKSISEQEAEGLLKLILEKFELIVERKLKRTVKQNEFDALVSFVYNCGGSQTLFEMVNSQSVLLRKWWETHYIMGGGKILNGLIARRKAESKIYFHE
jgi:lysozyme